MASNGGKIAVGILNVFNNITTFVLDLSIIDKVLFNAFRKLYSRFSAVLNCQISKAPKGSLGQNTHLYEVVYNKFIYPLLGRYLNFCLYVEANYL